MLLMPQKHRSNLFDALKSDTFALFNGKRVVGRFKLDEGPYPFVAEMNLDLQTGR
jgi:hypothetical protein